MFLKSHPENIKTVSIITMQPRLPQKCGKKPMDLLDNIVYHIHHRLNTIFTQYPSKKSTGLFGGHSSCVGDHNGVFICWERLAILIAKIVNDL